MLQSEWKEKNLQLSVNYNASAFLIEADPKRLYQILWNLFRNAAKSTSPNGTIQIRSENVIGDDGLCLLRVSVIDDGAGIESELLPNKVFEINALRRQADLGLELFICKSLVDLHGGRLIATSDGIGKGSQFALTFSTIPNDSKKNGTDESLAEVAAAVSSPPGESARQLRVLLVEDNATTRMIMTRLLQKELRCLVFDANSIEKAKQLAAASSFDIVLSDIGLPEGDGWSLMRFLKQTYGLRGVAVSGYGTEADVKRSKDAGFSAHLIKPIRLATLRWTLQAVLYGDRSWVE